jgi:hypothetical protein
MTNDLNWKDNLLECILRPEMIATIPVEAKNLVLRRLQDNVSDSRKFDRELTASPIEEIFSLTNKKPEPTVGTDALKAAIIEKPDLFNKIILLYYSSMKKGRDWRDNLLEHILPPAMIATLPVEAKNWALRNTYKAVIHSNKFEYLNSLYLNPHIFASAKFPPTLNTDALKAAIAERPEVVDQVAYFYYIIYKEAKWIQNLVQYILPQQIINILPLIAKNGVLAECHKSLKATIGEPLLLRKNGFFYFFDKPLFSQANKKHEPTFGTTELKAIIEKDAALLDEMVWHYYKTKKPATMQHILNYLLTKETIKNLPNIAKNQLFKVLNGYMKLDVEKIFTLGEEASLSDPHQSKLRNIKDRKPELLPLITNVFHEQGRPEWMKSMLKHKLFAGLSKKHQLNQSEAIKATLPQFLTYASNLALQAKQATIG